LLIAAMGEALTDEERPIFAKLTGRAREPGERVDELWCVIGRRGGKSRAIAALLVYLATMVDYRDQLVSGERGVVLCLARVQEQAQLVLEYVAGIIDNAPILAKLVIRPAADSLTLSNHGAKIEIAVRAASFRNVRGLTCVAAVADELAFWQAEDGSANPDTEILRAVRPSLLTTQGPLIAISSPYARRGELWTTFQRHYGAQGDPRILVAHAASREMNPTLRQADIDREMERDPAAGLAEYGAEFRTDISAFVPREIIDGCVAPGVFELRPAAGVSYLGFVDPSGGASDAMALAIAHRLGDMFILDAAREIPAPFNPDAATTEFSTLLKAYGVAKVIGDRYAGEWVREPFRRHGIEYLVSEAPKSDIYRDALHLLIAGRARLLDNKRLINQLCSLERRTARGGRELIDHPQHPGAHDDLANAVCGAFVMLQRDPRPQLISVADVVGVDGLPPPLPPSEYVFATVWAAGADVAVVYGASPWGSDELFVADFDAVLYHGRFFADLATRLKELAKACPAYRYFGFLPNPLARVIPFSLPRKATKLQVFTGKSDRRRRLLGGSEARIIMGSDEAALIRLSKETGGKAGSKSYRAGPKLGQAAVSPQALLDFLGAGPRRQGSLRPRRTRQALKVGCDQFRSSRSGGEPCSGLAKRSARSRLRSPIRRRINKSREGG
jgi:hypothetical protein